MAVKYRKYKEELTLNFPYPTRIEKDITDADQLWGVRNLTNSRQNSQYHLKRLLLVLLPAGQSY